MAYKQASSTVLAIAMVISGYLGAICCTPPNQTPDKTKRNKVDRLAFMARLVPLFLRQLMIIMVSNQALLAVIPEYAPDMMTTVCPRPENLNPTLFSWTLTSACSLMLMLIGAYVRLSAYEGLGRNFTFHLAEPDQLVTGGIYAWMQHPSYTGQMLIVNGCILLFLRWDGAMACWIDGSSLAKFQGWGFPAWILYMVMSVWLLKLRARDEEDMLKRKFGKQWEQWNQSTKRFIPGLF